MQGPGAGGWVQPVTKLPLPQFPTQQPPVLTSRLVCPSTEHVRSSHWMEGKTEAQECSHRALEPGQVSWEASRTNALADLADRMGKTPSRGATVSLGQRAPSQAPRARPRGSVAGGLLSVRAGAPTSELQGDCGAVGWGQQGPCPISPDLINGPFISVLEESAIFCLLN